MDTHLYERRFVRGRAALNLYQADEKWTRERKAARAEARREGRMPADPMDSDGDHPVLELRAFEEHVQERGGGIDYDYNADPSKLVVVVSSRPADVAILAIPQEPPVVVLPSTLALDLLQLLAFDKDGGGEREGGRAGGVFRHTVGVRVEEEGEEGRAGGQDGGEVVWAHKSFLTKRCPHFQAMLGSGMREASQPIITLTDVTPPVLRALLVYIYTDTLQATAAVQTVLLPLLLLAHRYGLSPLVALCSGYLRQALVDRGSCLDILKWSDAYQLRELKETCMAVVVMRAWEVEEEAQGRGEEGEEEGLSEGLKEEMMEFRKSLHLGEAGVGEEGKEEEGEMGEEAGNGV